MPTRKHLVLIAVIVLGACGNVSLARGMKAVGNLTLSHWTQLFTALLNPWIIGGILLLLGFLASYLTALSWADLTFVLPATAAGYILTALQARLFLHEVVPPRRWIGILLISVGVGFVAGSPALTAPKPGAAPSQEAGCESPAEALR